jgi:small ligand-binding sensory domain FIST
VPFVSALSRHPETAVAVGEVVGRVLEQLGGEPDLVVCFVSPSHLPAVDQAAATIQTLLSPAVFVGTSAVGVLAADEGVETRPGLSVWAARWSQRHEAASRIVPLALSATGHPSGQGWEFNGLDGTPLTPGSQLLLLADPSSFPVDEFLSFLATRAPGVGVIGGLASTAHTPSGNRLIIGGRVLRTGAVAVIVPAELVVDPLVSQGCRPIGDPMTVTKSTENVLYELAGRPALDKVLELVENLSDDDRALASLGLHCGIVVDESKLDFERGDFLIRGVLGASKEHRAVVIGDRAPIGTTLQFQVRDAVTAGEDLEELLLIRTGDADAGLVFTCNGRGATMFGDSNHDASVVSRRLPGAIAGMFCAGEIGPIGGRNAVHGFTASVALFRE